MSAALRKKTGYAPDADTLEPVDLEAQAISESARNWQEDVRKARQEARMGPARHHIVPASRNEDMLDDLCSPENGQVLAGPELREDGTVPPSGPGRLPEVSIVRAGADSLAALFQPGATPACIQIALEALTRARDKGTAIDAETANHIRFEIQNEMFKALESGVKLRRKQHGKQW